MTNYVNIRDSLKKNDVLINSNIPLQTNVLHLNLTERLFDYLESSPQVLNAFVDMIYERRMEVTNLESALKILELAASRNNSRAFYLGGIIYGDLLKSRVTPPHLISAEKSINYLARAVELGDRKAGVVLVKAITEAKTKEHFKKISLKPIFDRLIKANFMYAALVYGDMLCGLDVGYEVCPVKINTSLGMQYLAKAYELADKEDRQLVYQQIESACQEGILPINFYHQFMPASLHHTLSLTP